MSDEETKTQEQPVQEVEQVEQVEEPKITVAPKKKEKDPKKVAQGKRLAQISERAKKEKMRRELEQENQLEFSVNYHSLLAFGLLPIVVFSGFYLYSRSKNQVKISPKKSPPQTKNDEQPQRKFVSLFD